MGKRTAALMAVVFAAGCGNGQPSVVHVDDDNPIMVSAIEEARESVDRFVEALRKPGPGQSGHSVKMLVEEGGQGEHMWISPVTYANGKFSGVINNVPESLPSVNLGDRVTVAADEISDWMFIENETLVGGYTIRALVEILPPDERPQLPFRLE